MSSKQSDVLPSTRIITLLEQNDATDPETKLNKPSGQWTNNLAENTVIREGDVISVKQSMIDTTNESEGLIEVKNDETEITIKFGMYVQDSGIGTVDGGVQPPTYLSHSNNFPSTNIPNGRNYILQNQVKGLPFQELWYNAGSSYAGNTAINPGTSPANDFSVKFIPSTNPAVDWWEYTIDTGAAGYVAPAGGPFPTPPTNAVTSPILLAENLHGLHVILFHNRNPSGALVTYYKIYADGWIPADPVLGPGDNDHIGIIEAVFASATSTTPLGFRSVPNQFFAPVPAVANDKQWVFRTANPPPGADTGYQYWSDIDPDSDRRSKTYRVCEKFYMIVDNFSMLGTDPNATDAPYQQSFSYYDLSGQKITQRIYLSDWGNANELVYGEPGGTSDPRPPGLFYQHETPDNEVIAQGLPVLETPQGRKAAGYSGPAYNDNVISWVTFQQLKDRKNPEISIFEPFVYDIHKGIEVLPNGSISGQGTQKRDRWGGNGFAFGIFNVRTGATPNLMLPGQIVSSPLPSPNADGVVLTPRIFSQTINIPSKKYTYAALAQELTDQFNRIPRQVPRLSNNPDDTTQALNAVGFSGSRILTSTYELGMQQKVALDGSGDIEPFFPSPRVWTTADAGMQPVWVSDDGKSAVQYIENIVGAAPIWCGAESLSFIYDQSSDTFQVGQAHSNMYSRLDGGIIARQFKVDTDPNIGAGYITADKAGGIFFTSMEPASLFFTKMKLNQARLITPISSNPTLQDLTMPVQPGPPPQNTNLGNALTHSTTLINGDNITGNFVGLSTKIDKRTRVVSDPPVPSDNPGGEYQIVNTAWALDVAVATPVTIPGFKVTDLEVADPYFQIEISGLVRQDILGAVTKNNLIQSMVGKYFTNGGYTSGNVEDGFRYVHQGEPISLRSLSVRILDSNGDLATGLGDTSAVILEIDSDK